MAQIQAPANGLADAKAQIAADLTTCDSAVTDMQTYLAITNPTANQQTQQIKTLSQDIRQLARVLKRVLRAERDLIKAAGK